MTDARLTSTAEGPEAGFARHLAEAWRAANLRDRRLLERAWPERFGLSFDEITRKLDAMNTLDALWWFMENIDEEHPWRSDLYFYLRRRGSAVPED